MSYISASSSTKKVNPSLKEGWLYLIVNPMFLSSTNKVGIDREKIIFYPLWTTVLCGLILNQCACVDKSLIFWEKKKQKWAKKSPKRRKKTFILIRSTLICSNIHHRKIVPKLGKNCPILWTSKTNPICESYFSESVEEFGYFFECPRSVMWKKFVFLCGKWEQCDYAYIAEILLWNK